MLRWSLTRPSMWLLVAPPGLASALSTAVGVRKDASRYGPDASCTARQGTVAFVKTRGAGQGQGRM